MQVRQLDESEVWISRVGLGGFELGPELTREPDVAGAVEVIAAARDVGMNWVDTSEAYIETRNEALVGAALERMAASDLIVTTKVAPESS